MYKEAMFNAVLVTFVHLTIQPEFGEGEEVEESFGGLVSKEILRGVSAYFNPGNMIGIMGPTGSGKTTLLDVLTGRRTAGTIKVGPWCCE